MTKNRYKTTDLVYIALCAVLIAVCSWVSIPSTIPFTMQTFAIFCVLGLLGGRRGTIAVVVYLLLGAIGLPVFASFTGGAGILLGTTGGYMMGFIFMGIIYWLFESLIGDRLAVRIVSMVLGLAVCYAFGTGWFMLVYARQTGAIGLSTALAWCVLPFVIPDLIKMVLALLLSGKLSRALQTR